MDVILMEMVQEAKKNVEDDWQEIASSDEDKTDKKFAFITEFMSKLNTTSPNTNAGKYEPICIFSVILIKSLSLYILLEVRLIWHWIHWIRAFCLSKIVAMHEELL